MRHHNVTCVMHIYVCVWGGDESSQCDMHIYVCGGGGGGQE